MKTQRQIDFYQISCKEYLPHVELAYANIDWDYSDEKIGSVIDVTPTLLFPRYSEYFLIDNTTEWDSVNPEYAPNIESPIEVKINSFGELVVVDGHHRLKHFLSKNTKWVKVKIVGKLNTYKM